MRLVVDTNILISALLARDSLPAQLVTLWRDKRFDVLTSREQIDELNRGTRYPKLRARLPVNVAGRLINQLRDIGILLTDLPPLHLAADPDDDYLLAMAQVGAADFLITGDRAHVLAIGTHGRTRVLTVRDFLTLHRYL